VCESPHQREKEGRRYFEFRGNFDDGMVFEVTTNMETPVTLGPPTIVYDDHCYIQVDLVMTNRLNRFLCHFIPATCPASVCPLFYLWNVLSSASARKPRHKGSSQGLSLRQRLAKSASHAFKGVEREFSVVNQSAAFLHGELCSYVNEENCIRCVPEIRSYR